MNIEAWEPGIVFLESAELKADKNLAPPTEAEIFTLGTVTLTQHRCWNVSRFHNARLDDARSKSGKGEPAAVRFLSATEYMRKGGR